MKIDEIRNKYWSLTDMEKANIVYSALKYAWELEVLETGMKNLIDETEEEWKMDKLLEWLNDI